MSAQNFDTAQFETASDLVDTICRLEKDIGLSGKPLYMSVVKDVFDELNLSTIKHIERAIIKVDPHLKVIDMPDHLYQFSSICAVTKHSRFVPLFFNTELTEHTVDTGLDKCRTDECDDTCGEAICNISKQYEAITEEVDALMPDGSTQTFTKTTRKKINGDGSVYLEVTEPTAVYVGGVHTDTVMQTHDTYLCKFDIKPCGCIINNEHNRDEWMERGSSLFGPCSYDLLSEWGYMCPDLFPRELTYNLSNDRKRIKLDARFPFEKVMVRFYASKATKDLLIPRMAKRAMMFGIKHLTSKFDKDVALQRSVKWGIDYDAECNNLSAKLAMMTVDELQAYWFGDNNARHVYYNTNINFGYYGYGTTPWYNGYNDFYDAGWFRL